MDVRSIAYLKFDAARWNVESRVRQGLGPVGAGRNRSVESMRAVVFAAEGKLALQERPELDPGPGEVVVQTAAVGICGTDTHVLDGEFEGTVFPLVPGHEATGVVVAVGAEVPEGAVRVGDPVAVNPSTTCGACEYCRTGRSNLCRSWNGLGVVASDGAAQERFVAPLANVYRLRPE